MAGLKSISDSVSALTHDGGVAVTYDHTGIKTGANFPVIFSENQPPFSPTIGSLWYKKSTNALSFFNGSSWKSLGSTSTPSGPTISDFGSVPTARASSTAVISDSAGNIYWSSLNQSNFITPSSNTEISRLWKITPAGFITEIANCTTYGGSGTALAVDGSGNLYWAVVNNYDKVSYTQTSYVYKIVLSTAGTVLATIYRSQQTTAAWATALHFDFRRNDLYWAITETYQGTNTIRTSKLFRLNPAIEGGGELYAESDGLWLPTGTDITSDAAGNVYWAIAHDGEQYTQSTLSTIYKINHIGQRSILVQKMGSLVNSTSIQLDSNENYIYWALASGESGYTKVYKYTVTGGQETVIATSSIERCSGTKLRIQDSTGDLYWSVVVTRNIVDEGYNAEGFLVKISMNGSVGTLIKTNTMGATDTDIVVKNDKIYWAVSNSRADPVGMSYNIDSKLYKVVL